MGPYKEKEEKDDSFMLNDMPNKDGKVYGKNKKIKGKSRLWIAKLINCVCCLKFKPPWKNGDGSQANDSKPIAC